MFCRFIRCDLVAFVFIFFFYFRLFSDPKWKRFYFLVDGDDVVRWTLAHRRWLLRLWVEKRIDALFSISNAKRKRFGKSRIFPLGLTRTMNQNEQSWRQSHSHSNQHSNHCVRTRYTETWVEQENSYLCNCTPQLRTNDRHLFCMNTHTWKFTYATLLLSCMNEHRTFSEHQLWCPGILSSVLITLRCYTKSFGDFFFRAKSVLNDWTTHTFEKRLLNDILMSIWCIENHNKQCTNDNSVVKLSSNWL